MPNYQGVWSLSTQYQAQGQGNWPPNYVPPPRALFAGAGNIIDYVQVDTTGNATDFGDLSSSPSRDGGSGSSSTRALFSGAADSIARIDTVQIFSEGNATDFGDLTKARTGAAGLSNSTRCIWFMGKGDDGASDWTNIIDYVTIASLGNATDFGDTLAGQYNGGAGTGSSTRGVVGGGQSTNSASSVVNVLQYVTISSAGNATDFGDLTLARRTPAALSSSTRAVWGGGRNSSNVNSNIMDYITIASTGNATDFGDLATGGFGQNEGTGSNTRGIFAPGFGDPNFIQLDYITIASTGNSTTFGNLTGSSRYGCMACSSAHGGLS